MKNQTIFIEEAKSVLLSKNSMLYCLLKSSKIIEKYGEIVACDIIDMHNIINI